MSLVSTVKFKYTPNVKTTVTFKESSQVKTTASIQKVYNAKGGQYSGDYDVVPRVTEQTLPTKNKILIEDVIIKSIPYFDVSNTSGGSTVYIGEEV